MTLQEVEYNIHLKGAQKDLYGFRKYSYREQAKRTHARRVLDALLYPDLDHLEDIIYCRDMLMKGIHQPRQYSPFIEEIKFAIKHYKTQKQLQLL